MEKSFEALNQFISDDRINTSIRHLKFFYSSVKFILSADNYKDLYYFSISLIINPRYKFSFAILYRQHLHSKFSNVSDEWIDTEIQKLTIELIKIKSSKRKKKPKFKIRASGAFAKSKTKNIKNSNHATFSLKGLNRKPISIAKKN